MGMYFSCSQPKPSVGVSWLLLGPLGFYSLTSPFVELDFFCTLPSFFDLYERQSESLKILDFCMYLNLNLISVTNISRNYVN